MRRIAAIILGVAAIGVAGPGLAQSEASPQPPTFSVPPLSMGQVRSPVLTVDTERLFVDSRFGQRIARAALERTEELAAENRVIAADLTEEENALTQARSEMPIEDFRAAAEAFDLKVQEIRLEQDSKQRALQDGLVEGRDAFLQAATPVLARLMQESGAAVVLDRRSVFLSVDVVDITDEAITAIDAEIGEGNGQPMPDLTPGDGSGSSVPGTQNDTGSDTGNAVLPELVAPITSPVPEAD